MEAKLSSVLEQVPLAFGSYLSSIGVTDLETFAALHDTKEQHREFWQKLLKEGTVKLTDDADSIVAVAKAVVAFKKAQELIAETLTGPRQERMPILSNSVTSQDSNQCTDWLTSAFVVRALNLECARDWLFDSASIEDYRTAKPELQRRGGVLYRTPVGWKRFPLKVSGNYDDGDMWSRDDGQPGEWAVAYHGTHRDAAKNIVCNGFALGIRHGPAALRLKDSRTGQHIGPGVCLTPSLEVAECFANGEEQQTGRPPVTVDGHTLWFIIECRVRPGAIRRPQNKIYTKTNNDEEKMGIDGVFEWVIEHTADVRPIAVLVRDVLSAPNHQHLHSLARSYANRSCVSPHTFDSVPGKIEQGLQLAAEEQQILSMHRATPGHIPVMLTPPANPAYKNICPNFQARVVFPLDGWSAAEWAATCNQPLPDQLAAKGLAAGQWNEMMASLQLTQTKAWKWPCFRIWVFFIILFFIIGRVFVVPLLIGALLPLGFFLDVHQMHLKLWLRRTNAELEPLGIFVKFQNIKRDFHERKYISFAFSKKEVKRLRSEPCFQRGEDLFHQEDGCYPACCPVDWHRVV